MADCTKIIGNHGPKIGPLRFPEEVKFTLTGSGCAVFHDNHSFFADAEDDMRRVLLGIDAKSSLAGLVRLKRRVTGIVEADGLDWGHDPISFRIDADTEI